MPKWDNEPPKSNVRPSPPMPPDAAAGDTTATVPHDTYIISFKAAVSYKIFYHGLCRISMGVSRVRGRAVIMPLI